MKKIMIFLCIAGLLLPGLPVFAGEEIPDYEPWNYMVTAALGSCNSCDPSYSFKTNFELRKIEESSNRSMARFFGGSGGEKNPLMDMSAGELILTGVITAAVSFIVFAVLFERSEYIKMSY